MIDDTLIPAKKIAQLILKDEYDVAISLCYMKCREKTDKGKLKFAVRVAQVVKELGDNENHINIFITELRGRIK